MKNPKKKKTSRAANSVQQQRHDETPDWFHLVLDNISDLVAILDLKGKRLYNSPSYKNVLDDPEALLGTDSFQEIHPDDREKIKSIFRNTVETGIGKRAEYRFLCKDGSMRYIESQGNVILDKEGKPSRIIVVSRDVSERKKIIDSLKRSEERYRLLVELSPDAIAVHSEGIIVFVNQAGVKLLGAKNQAQLVGKPVMDFVHPDYRRVVSQRIQEMIQNGKQVSLMEEKFIRLDGKIIDVEVTAIPVSYNGKTALQVIIRDITEKKQFEEISRRSQQNYETLIHSIDGIVWEADADLNFTFVSKQAERMLGYPVEQWLGEPKFWVNHIHPDDRSWAPEFCLSKIQEKVPHQFEYRMISRDRSTIWVRDIVNVDNSVPVKVRGVIVDITERKKAEEAIRASEEKYRTLFEESHDAVFTSTPAGKWLEINPAGVELFGYASREELLRVDIAKDLYLNPETRERFKQLLKQDGFVRNFESVIKTKDGQIRYVLETTSAVRDETGNIVAYRGIIRDITERKKLEQQLMQAQKMESIGTLAGGIAHDFNNILAIMLMYTMTLEQMKSDPEKFAKSIEALEKAIQRGTSLVRQLLTFARKTDVQLASADVNELAEETKKLIDETFPKTITCSLDLQPGIPAVVADANQLHQALLNLCVNARDAMPHGGAIQIKTRTISGSRLRKQFTDAKGEEYVCVSVSDTGVGMDELTKSQIFDPFFTTKGPGRGTGLGLSVVFGIVDSHHGFIDVESQMNQGTTFDLYFPVQPRHIEENRLAADQRVVASAGNETILVVEDEGVLTELLVSIIKDRGYKVITAADGLDAVNMYRDYQHEISLVFSDMGLPKLSGREAFLKMKEINPEVKMIFASGYIDQNMKSELLKQGVREFVQKPYEPAALLKKIREVIDSEKK